MNAQQQLAVKALEQMKGDDYARARAAFDGLTCEEMQQPHGASGKTREQILADYAERDARVLEAIEWVKSMTSAS